MVLDRVEPTHAEDILSAAGLADQHAGVSPQDLVHVAVMLRLGVDQVISAARDFDRLPCVTRLDHILIGEWSGSILAWD